MFRTISKTPISSPVIATPPPTTKSGVKITYDSNGKVVSSTFLRVSDIPSLPISKIIDLQDTLDALVTTPELPSGVLNNILYFNGSDWVGGDQTAIFNALSLGSAALYNFADFAPSSHSHSLLGDVTGPLGATSISNLSLSKLQSITASRLLGRGDASNGVPQEITLGSGLSMSGTTLSATGTGGTVTSVGLTMPSAFNVASSPVTTSGTIAVTGAGTTSDYIRGDGTLATFPSIPSGAALTKVDDTNVTLTLGGSPSTALINAASLTLGWSGQLSVPRGGLNLSTVAQGDLLYGSAANTYALLPKNTTATRYLSNTGTSNNPAWAQINLTNGVTGDLPFANIAQLSGLSVAGRSANSTGDIAAITAASDHQVLRRSGTTIGFGQLNLAQSAAVTGILGGTNGGTALSTFTAVDRIPYAASATALTTSSNLTFNGTGLGIGTPGNSTYRLDVSGKTRATETATITSTINSHELSSYLTTSTNSLSPNGLYLATTYNNAANTNSYYSAYRFASTIGQTNTSTTLVSMNGFNGLINLYGNSIGLAYGMGVRMDERATAPTANGSRFGLTGDVFKFAPDTDNHNATGIQARVIDYTTNGRWNVGQGVVVSVDNALTGYGINASVTNTKGTNNTQYGLNVSNGVANLGVSVANAYGINLVHYANSSATITNYYGILSNSAPVATNPYGLYFSVAGWRNFINGNLALGVNDNSSRLFIRGSGTTSSTHSIFVENSSGTDYFKLNDAGQLYLGSSTPNASAIFQIDSTTLGFARPRMTLAQRDAISSPLEGLSVYNSTTKGMDYYNGTRWIRTSQTTGTPTLTAATGYSAASATGNDLSGYFTFTSAGSAGTGKVLDFDFAHAFPASSNYSVVLSPKSTYAAVVLLSLNISNVSTTGFDINFDDTINGAYILADTHEFYYQIVQTN